MRIPTTLLPVSLSCLLFASLTGCQEEQTPVQETAAEAAAFNVAGAPTVEFEVPAMMCEESCAKKVRELLADQAGVKDVVVDFPAKKATVAVDADKFDAQAAKDVLLDYGFDGSKVAGAVLPGEPALVPATGGEDDKKAEKGDAAAG
jgi:copper chaperone CopZ